MSKRCKIHRNNLRYTRVRKNAHQLLRSCKRESYYSRRSNLINYPECLHKEPSKITGKAKPKSIFAIKYDKYELITDDIDVAESLNEKFVSFSKTLAASTDNVHSRLAALT